jgi:hypothetical protein
MSKGAAEFVSVEYRPLRAPTPEEIKRALQSIVPEERVLVRSHLLNLPAKRGCDACTRYINERVTGISEASLYVIWRTLALLTEDKSQAKGEDDQLCML